MKFAQQLRQSAVEGELLLVCIEDARTNVNAGPTIAADWRLGSLLPQNGAEHTSTTGMELPACCGELYRLTPAYWPLFFPVSNRLLKKLIKAAAQSGAAQANGEAAGDSESGQPFNQPLSSATNTPLSASPTPSQEITARPATVPPLSPRRIARIQSRGSENSDNGLRRRKLSRSGSVREGAHPYILLPFLFGLRHCTLPIF